jgi:hypothetical protein
MEHGTTNRPRFGVVDLILLSVLALLVALVYRQHVPEHVYGYDEADYRLAAERGPAAHWLDRPSIPLRRFVASGLGAFSKQGEGVSLSERVRASEDLPFLRHYHGPIYWYGLIPAARLAGENERMVRCSGIVWAVLLAGTLYAGCLSLGLGRLPALAAALFVAFSPELIETFGVLNPHPPYVVISVLALFLGAHAIRDDSSRAWWGAAAVVGAAFATSAFAGLLAAALALGAVAAEGVSDRRRIAWRVLLDRCLLGAMLLALLWPAALLKLTLLRGYAFYGYLALGRPATYGSSGPLEAWWTRVSHSPLEWGLLVMLLLAGGLASRTKARARAVPAASRAWAAPFALYGVLVLLTTLFLTTPKARYISSLMPVLFVLASAGLTALLASARPTTRVSLTLVLAIALGCNLWLADRAAPLAPQAGDRLDDRVVGQLAVELAEARLILPRYYIPLARWYVPRARLLGRDRPADLLEAASRWRPDAVLYWGERDVELEAALIEARGASLGESRTVSGGSRRLTILLLDRGGPRFAALPQSRAVPGLVAPERSLVTP